MPEARDRLSRRQDDPSALFLRQRSQLGSLQILPDEPAVNTIRWGSTALNGATTGVAATRGRGGGGRGAFGTPRVGNGRGRAFSNRENTPARSVRRTPRGGGGSQSILPSWYPRKPLQDITPIVKAIERRRARLREVEEGLQLSSPLPQGQSVHSPSVLVSGAPLEHEFSLISPSPAIKIRRCPPTVGKVPKILLDITQQNDGPSAFLTPEKKLLNSIDKVQKVVTQELNRLKRTPAAKRAEREKKVRALMSMR